MRWGTSLAFRSERADLELVVVAELDDRAVLDDLPRRVAVVRLRGDDHGFRELPVVEHEQRVPDRGGEDALTVGEEEVQARRREVLDERDDRDRKSTRLN